MEKENEFDDSPFGDIDLTALGDLAEVVDLENTEEVTPDVNKEKSSNDDEQFPFQIEEEEVEEEEKTDQKEEEKEKTGDPSSKEKQESEKFPLTPYAKLLVEEGVLQNFDIEKFDGKADSLIDAVRNQIVGGIEEYKNTLDPRVKWLQDNIEEGVPLEALLRIDRERVTFSNLTDKDLTENVDLQKNIVREYFRKTTTGWSDTRIEKEVNRLSDLGELENEAKEFFGELKGFAAKEEEYLRTQAKKQQEEMIKEQQKTLDTFKKKLEDLREVIPGNEVPKTVKDDIFKTMTTVVAYDENGTPLNAIAKARAENPLDFEMTLAYLYNITKGFKDWSSIVSSGKKKAIKEFEEAAGRLDIQKQQGQFYKDETVSDQKTKTILDGMKVFQKR